MSGQITNPPSFDQAYFPALQPPDPFSLPGRPFDLVLNKFGLRLAWGKSHTCPCIAWPSLGKAPGTPNPACTTCQGRGIYWDLPLVPFTGLITYGHTVQAQNEPGAKMDKTLGQIVQGEPRLTIPYSAGWPWQEASEFDVFVELDATYRYNTTLSVSGVTYVPYQHNLTIAASGAVSSWNPATSGVVAVTGYSVSGAQVLMPSGTAANTPYVVEFTAAPSFVAFRLDGGFPHVRPFVGGTVAYPKRFRLIPMDLWIRSPSVANF